MNQNKNAEFFSTAWIMRAVMRNGIAAYYCHINSTHIGTIKMIALDSQEWFTPGVVKNPVPTKTAIGFDDTFYEYVDEVYTKIINRPI